MDANLESTRNVTINPEYSQQTPPISDSKIDDTTILDKNDTNSTPSLRPKPVFLPPQ